MFRIPTSQWSTLPSSGMATRGQFAADFNTNGNVIHFFGGANGAGMSHI